MAVDTPASVLVMGAGPIGLEAALYARFLGYDVRIVEQGRVGEHVLRWGHVRMFTPFAMNSTPLALGALAAQDSTYRPPAPTDLLTGREWVERYLRPLSQTDLLVDGLLEQTTCVAIGRDGLLKPEWVGREERGDWQFRVLVRNSEGRERFLFADIVIDTTGVFGCPNWLGASGLPAIGETNCRAEIEYGLPDVLGAERDRYAGRHTLLIGAGHSAATTVVALAELASRADRTQVTWLTRHPPEEPRAEPITRIPGDRLPQRDALAERANSLAAGVSPHVRHRPGTNVEAIRRTADGQFAVDLDSDPPETLTVDRIVAQVGGHPDRSLYAELQVHECYATGGPMKLAAALVRSPSVDCLAHQSTGPQTLLNPEPNFYILGAKGFGRNATFVAALGYEQIRDLFSLIGDRETLDLYLGRPQLM